MAIKRSDHDVTGLNTMAIKSQDVTGSRHRRVHHCIVGAHRSRHVGDLERTDERRKMSRLKRTNVMSGLTASMAPLDLAGGAAQWRLAADRAVVGWRLNLAAYGERANGSGGAGLWCALPHWC
jgi:hypothetical protein